MGSWRSIALPNLRGNNFQKYLDEFGLESDNSFHVTATNSLTSHFLNEGQPAVSVGSLLDLVTLSHLQSPFSVDYTNYQTIPVPNPDSEDKKISVDTKKWSNLVTHSKFLQNLAISTEFKKFCKAKNPNFDKSQLQNSLKELRRTILGFENAGLEPEILNPRSEISRVAKEFWKELRSKRDFNFIQIGNDLFWSETHDVHLKKTFENVLAHLLGARKIRNIYLHGFYFYTPIQMALFRKLKTLTGYNLIFIVHDDQVSPSFEIWRRYFNAGFGLPAPEFDIQGAASTSQDDNILRKSLRSNRIEVGSQTEVECLRFTDSTHMVRYLAQLKSVSKNSELEHPKPIVFSAAEKDIERYQDRLGDVLNSDSVSLYQLPLGIFLLKLHECIRTEANGLTLFEIKAEDLQEMLPYLFSIGIDHGIEERQALDSLRFFSDCLTVEDWVERSKLLVAINAKFDTFQNQENNASVRSLIPWLSFGTKKAEALEKLVLLLLEIIQKMGEFKTESISSYGKSLGELLRVRLTTNDYEEISNRLSIFELGENFEYERSDLLEVVKKLLGKETQYDSEFVDELTDSGSVKPIRNLDVYAYRQNRQHIFLANLSDRAFPQKKRPQIWPFSIDEIDSADCDGMAILYLNSETSALGDLYLLDCAFGSVVDTGKMSLTWMMRVDGEQVNPSPALNLILEPEVGSSEVREHLGGLKVITPNTLDVADAQWKVLSFIDSVSKEATPTVSESGFDSIKLSSALVCERRFALQWGFSRDSSFSSHHTQNMLFGNLLHYLKRVYNVSQNEALDICDEVFPFLTDDIKASSRWNSRTAKADPVWIFNLSGSATADVTRGKSLPSTFERFSASYQAAKSNQGAIGLRKLLEIKGSQALPPVPKFANPKDVDGICNLCPVANKCIVKGDEHEDDSDE